jgi:hypothetical protein
LFFVSEEAIYVLCVCVCVYTHTHTHTHTHIHIYSKAYQSRLHYWLELRVYIHLCRWKDLYRTLRFVAW